MSPPIQRSGIVLAGGRSSRLGRAKALAIVAGRPLVERVAAVVAEVTGELIVVLAAATGTAHGEPDESDIRHALGPPHREVRFARDRQASLGPLAGLVAGLAAARGEVAIVTACDMPFLGRPLLDGLLRALDEPDSADVVIPRRDGHLMPVCAAYRVHTALPVLASQLDDDVRRPTARLDRLRTRTIEGAELEALCPLGRELDGVNDATELALAEARLLSVPARPR